MKRLILLLSLLSPLVTPSPALPTPTDWKCYYTITQTWYGTCTWQVYQYGEDIHTSNGHTVRIRGVKTYQPYLTGQPQQVYIDGHLGTLYNTGCSVTYTKDNGTFSLTVYTDDPHC